MADGILTEGALLEVSDDDGATYDPIVERGQLNIAKTGETIDMSSFDDEGFRALAAGLRTISVEASGNYVPSDAGYAIVEDSWLNRTPIWVRASWRTSAPGDPETREGWILPNAVITNDGEAGPVGDKVTLSLAFASGGKPTKYTV